MRYAFYISGQSGRLTKILDKYSSNELVLVISDKKINKNLQKIIESKQMKIEIIDDDKLEGKRKEKNLQISNFILEKLMINKIDYLFSFGSHILSGELLKKYENKLINFHPALLPMFPGVSAIDQAVKHGNVLLVGNTAHFIDEGVDTGKIIMQSVIPLQSFKTSMNYDVVLDIQIQMFEKIIKIIDNDLLEINNNEVTIKNADYSKYNIYPYVEID